jgi:hypothetical protein
MGVLQTLPLLGRQELKSIQPSATCLHSRSGAPWPYLPADAQCRPDASGRSSIFALHFKFSGWVNDANHPLGSRVHVHMPHFYRLLVPSAVSVQGLHQIEL